MARGNDDARFKPKGAGEVGHCRRRNRTAEDDVGPCSGEARLKRGFEHVARNAGVLANKNGGAARRAMALQHPARSLAELHHEVGRDGELPNLASNTIRTKITPIHTESFID